MRCVAFFASILLSLALDFSAFADVDYAAQVQPILAKRCYACHGPDQQEGGIRFDQFETLASPADSGQTPIIPSKPADSELLRRVQSQDPSNQMPPEGQRLSAKDVELLRAWIDEGAKFSKHWAFQPISDPAIPSLQSSSDEACGPIDLFVLRKLEEAKLPWVPRATPQELVRRVFLDVIGLPPTPEAVLTWTENWNEDSYQRLVDDLLANPSFGERWARMWLDVVRYAESNSFERDNPKPNAWKYRDYVINSFNSDKPFDHFVLEQLAGDELDQVTLDTLTATGYYRLGIWDDEPADPLLAMFDGYDDIVSTTGQAFLGLTFGCARCHDHKIDPLTQKDYYSLVAFVRDVTPYADRADQETNNQLDLYPDRVREHKKIDSRIRLLTQKIEKREQAAIKEMSAEDQRATEGDQRAEVLKNKLEQYMDAEEWKEYCQQQDDLQAAISAKSQLPKRVTTLGLARLDPKPPQTFILRRGSPQSEAEPVDPSYPELLGGGKPIIDEPLETASSAGRRRPLAEWIASPENWLTARVITNRVWLHYFGRGIVRSPNNFGLMGEPPTHPELLDYLATNLIRSGWSLKQLHRQILLSSTYQRSSMNLPESAQRDPQNNLFWRQNLRRLSAEQVRDGILAVSGQINLEQFGPPMYPDLSSEVLASQSQPGRNWEKSPLSEQARRSVYVHVKRSLPVPMLSVFDFPETDLSCEARFLTIQPSQALTMLNSHWMQQQAEHLLQRVQREVGDDLRLQAQRCLELVSSRPASDGRDAASDVQVLVDLVHRLKDQEGQTDAEARRNMCLVAFNLNSFIFLD